MTDSMQQVISQHGAPACFFIYCDGMILFEKKQIPPYMSGDRLTEEQQGAVDSQPVAENSRCQSVVGADPAEGDNMPGVSFASFGQDKLQLSDFVAAIHKGTQIIAFNPEVFITQPVQLVDGRGEGPQGEPGYFLFQFRIISE